MQATVQDRTDGSASVVQQQASGINEAKSVNGPPAGFGQSVNGYLNGYVVFADSKIGGLIGASLTVAAVLLANQPATNWSLISNWAAILCLGLAALVGTFVISPRIIEGGKGVIFWEDIVEHGSPAAYHAAIQYLDAAQVEREYAAHNFYTSKVLRAKYRATRWCAVLFTIGVMLAFLRFVLAAL